MTRRNVPNWMVASTPQILSALNFHLKSNSDLLLLIPKIWNVPHFQMIY
jgi:hypothetical protein